MVLVLTGLPNTFTLVSWTSGVNIIENGHDAFEIIYWMGYPEEEYKYDSLSIDIVDIIGGLPLAIEVTASYLYENKGKNTNMERDIG